MQLPEAREKSAARTGRQDGTRETSVNMSEGLKKQALTADLHTQ
jgi:hypothetical protein